MVDFSLVDSSRKDKESDWLQQEKTFSDSLVSVMDSNNLPLV